MTKEKSKKKKKARKIFGIILLLLFAILAGMVVGGYSYIADKLGKIGYDNLAEEEIASNAGIKEQLAQYRNIALLGLDARTDTFTGTTRSDCIIIASIYKKNKEVKLVSVYRDTYLDIPEKGLDKVTHAYAYGGAKLTLSTLNTNLDLNITEYITVNFETLKTVVDAIGGVKITLTEKEVASIPNISSAGTYNLNGEQALAYARIRKIDTDYQRTERMRDVLTAIFEKIKSFSLGELNDLLDTVLPHLRTNIQSSEILTLLPQIASYQINDSLGWPYEVKAYTTPTWYGVPVTLEENVIQLHEKVFNQKNYIPSQTVKEISNKIIKKTGYQ